MNKFRKLAASIAAITTALSLSVGTLAVTANEVNKAIDTKPAYTLAKKQLIETYEKKGVADVTRFLLDNNFSLSETQNITELYIDGKNKRMQNESKTGNVRSTPDFYSTTNLSKKEHRGVVFIHNASPQNKHFDLSLRYNSAWSTIATSTQPDLLQDLENGYSLDFSSSPISFVGNADFSSFQSTPVALFDFPFTVTTNSATEKIIRDKLRFTTYYPTAYCTFYTYVMGDVNHDGLVNTIDLSMIIEITLESMTEYDLPDTYNNIDPSIALRINRLAGDMNDDGVINTNDLNIIANPAYRD